MLIIVKILLTEMIIGILIWYHRNITVYNNKMQCLLMKLMAVLYASFLITAIIRI